MTRQLPQVIDPLGEGGLFRKQRGESLADFELHFATLAHQANVFFEDQLGLPFRVDRAAQDFENFRDNHDAFIIVGSLPEVSV